MTDTWTWATVTQATPLRIKVDGDTTALDATTGDLVGSLAVDDRVRVHLHADGIIVTGIQGGGTPEATAATANTLALRDGSGQLKAADGVADDDVATVGQLIIRSAFLPQLDHSDLPSAYGNGLTIGNTGNDSAWPNTYSLVRVTRADNGARVLQEVIRKGDTFDQAIWKRSSIGSSDWGPWTIVSQDTGFIDITDFESGFSATTYSPPQFRLQNGRCYLSGYISGTVASAATAVLGKLPSSTSAYWPNEDRFYPSVTPRNSNRHGQYRIIANGDILVDTSPDGTATDFSLESVSWWAP